MRRLQSVCHAAQFKVPLDLVRAAATELPAETIARADREAAGPEAAAAAAERSRSPPKKAKKKRAKAAATEAAAAPEAVAAVPGKTVGQVAGPASYAIMLFTLCLAYYYLFRTVAPSPAGASLASPAGRREF